MLQNQKRLKLANNVQLNKHNVVDKLIEYSYGVQFEQKDVSMNEDHLLEDFIPLSGPVCTD